MDDDQGVSVFVRPKAERRLSDVGKGTRFSEQNRTPIKKACANEWCSNIVDSFLNKRGQRVLCDDCRREAKRAYDAAYYERVRDKKNEARRKKYREDLEYQARERAKARERARRRRHPSLVAAISR